MNGCVQHSNLVWWSRLIQHNYDIKNYKNLKIVNSESNWFNHSFFALFFYQYPGFEVLVPVKPVPLPYVQFSF